MKSLDGVNKKNDVNNTASEAPEKNVKIWRGAKNLTFTLNKQAIRHKTGLPVCYVINDYSSAPSQFVLKR
jgi:hypothetical protein